MKGADRNKPCPCGSGSKWKCCEPTHQDQTPSMTPEMEAQRDREAVDAYFAARARGRSASRLLVVAAAALR